MTDKINLDFELTDLFPKQEFTEWEETVTKDLKGKSPSELVTPTYEGIDLKPLYVESDLTPIPFTDNLPGFFNYVRGFNPQANVKTSWFIAQSLYADNIESLKEKYVHDLSKALNCININLSFNGTTITLNEIQVDNLKTVISFLNSKEFSGTMKLISSTLPLEINKVISEKVEDKINLIIATDLFSNIIKDGFFDKEYYSRTVKNFAPEDGPVKFLLDCTPVINSGGNAVQELATALAMASEIFNDPNSQKTFLNNFYVKLSLDSDFFMNVAKIRAMRILWTNFCREIDPETDFELFIQTESASLNKSVLDRHTNILRSASEAFAASLADADAITTLPFDFLETKDNELSRRIARNTQLILNEESHIGKVIDPLSGSYFIESLTKELCERVWDLFNRIENEGGFIASFESGFIQSLISETREKRSQDVETGKSKIIGVNFSREANGKVPNFSCKQSERKYVKLENVQEEENILNDKILNYTVSLSHDIKCEPLNPFRLTETFENDK